MAGIRDYGNRIGIPTVAGGVYFDPAYTGNCLVNVGCIGFLRKDKLLNNAVPGDRGRPRSWWAAAPDATASTASPSPRRS